jgi:hypothetical protein
MKRLFGFFSRAVQPGAGDFGAADFSSDRVEPVRAGPAEMMFDDVARAGIVKLCTLQDSSRVSRLLRHSDWHGKVDATLIKAHSVSTPAQTLND